MNDAPRPVPKKQLSFSQAQGLEPLPQQFKLGELSSNTRNRIHAVFHRSLDKSCNYSQFGIRLKDPWKRISEDIFVDRLNGQIDECSSRFSEWNDQIKLLILTRPFNSVFDFILYVLWHPHCPPGLGVAIQKIFEDDMLAYRLLLDPIEIIPIASQQEGEAILHALSETKAQKFSGARTHLIKAGKDLASGKFADSIRNSIHAVESIACLLDESNNTLGAALAALEKKITLHNAFKRGISSLYGYTCDEKGIRHASSIDEDIVDQTDAMFMFGACASFVTYLIGKARTAGLISEE